MEEHKLDQEEGRIDLYRLLPELGRALRRLFWVPLLLALLGAAAMGVRAWRSYVPLYHSEATFTIETSASALSDMAGSGSYYDKATDEQLAKFPAAGASAAAPAQTDPPPAPAGGYPPLEPAR